MAERVTYRRKCTYRTKSNRVRKVRTPGNRLIVQYQIKPIKHSICKETGVRLNGIPRTVTRRLKRRERSVSRPYGGVLSGAEVKRRITRAFLNEELKCIKAEAQKSRKVKKTGKRKN